MPNKYAIKTGNFNDPTVWSLNATGLSSATTVPTFGDNAVANSFIVEITESIACNNITNGTSYGGLSGGIFRINLTTASLNLTGNVFAGGGIQPYSTPPPCLSAFGTNSLTISGNIAGGDLVGGGLGLNFGSTGNLNIIGNIRGGNAGGSYQGNTTKHGVVTTTASNVNVYGNISSGQGSATSGLVIGGNTNVNVFGNVAINHQVNNGNTGMSSSSNGTIVVQGNVIGVWDRAINITSGNGSLIVYGNVSNDISTGTGQGIQTAGSGSVTIFGNLNAALGAAVSNTSTSSITVAGNIVANFRGGNGLTSTNAAAIIRLSGNLIGASNGIAAVYAASYRIDPVLYQSYIRYADNGTGVGTNAHLFHYTIDSLSAFTFPPASAVRAGLVYADNALTGTCVMPSPSSVAFGVPVDNTTGTAFLNANTLIDLYNVPVSSLTATNSLGVRLKNLATHDSIGRITQTMMRH